MVRRSVQTIEGDLSHREFQLVGEPRVRLGRIREGEVIHGGQFVDLRRGDWLEVELEVEVTLGFLLAEPSLAATLLPRTTRRFVVSPGTTTHS